MGLFEKLFWKDPLEDVTVKKYYEMIYSMKTSLSWYGRESDDKNSRARRYVEFLIGGTCEDDKFIKAVELINLSQKDYPNTKLEQELKAFNKSLDETRNEQYKCERDTAYKICYKELVDDFKKEYDIILDVIKDNVNCKLFGDGLYKRIHEKYFREIDLVVLYRITYIVIANSFFEGNATTKRIVLDYLLDIYRNRMNHRKSGELEIRGAIIDKMALKALHFEQYGKDKTGYTSITDDDCREFIKNNEKYEKILAEHPFDQEKYIERCIESIMKWSVFRKDYSSYNADTLFWFGVCDDYFIDAACNLVWKEIAKEYTKFVNDAGENVSESKNIKDVVTMLCDYFVE